METLDIIHKRASLKGCLSSREIEQDKITAILEAARMAPSSRNMQPWRFIVVKGKDAVENLVNRAFMEFNAVAKEAPVIIVVCANPVDDVVIDGKEYYLFDTALAVENMLLAATDLGLVTHLMTAVHEDELRKVLAIPPEVRFVVTTPLAYPKTDSYEGAAKERLGQRSRMDFSELVFVNKWGESAESHLA